MLQQKNLSCPHSLAANSSFLPQTGSYPLRRELVFMQIIPLDS